MIYVHSIERAVQFYPERPALYTGEDPVTFRELHQRVTRLAAGLTKDGFRKGDRLAVHLPNGPEYLELIYACSRLGVIVVPINVRLSPVEIDHVLADAGPRGLVRHSSLPAPSARLPWERVLDKEPLQGRDDPCPDALYDPEAILA
jgi:acyl-CoA synthetase (AMP-forming)/AMP-acid ligase II